MFVKKSITFDVHALLTAYHHIGISKTKALLMSNKWLSAI